MVFKEIREITESLAQSKKVIRFYNVVYEYLLCKYRPFLEQTVAPENRAMLPSSVLDRMESGNQFEARRIVELVDACRVNGTPFAYVAGDVFDLETKNQKRHIMQILSKAPEYQSFALAFDGDMMWLSRKSSAKTALSVDQALEAAANAGRVFVVAFNSYHDIEDKVSRDIAKRDVEIQTVQVMSDGIDAMKHGKQGSIIIGARLPRTYVVELDADLVGEPDLLVPVSEKATYTSVDYKDSSVFDTSTRTIEWVAAPATTPSLDNAVVTNLGRGVLRKKQRLQLAHYYLMLKPLCEALGTESTPYAGIIGRQGVAVYADVTEAMFGRGKNNLKSTMDLYLSTVAASQAVDDLGRIFLIDPDIEVPLDVGPAKKTVCTECVFRHQCAQERKETSHLTLHPDLGELDSLELAEALPAPTLKALAYAEPAALTQSIIDNNVKRFGQTPEPIHAKVQILIDGARAIMQDKTYRRRSQTRVPTLEAVVEIHPDFENNNNPMANGAVKAGHWFQTGWMLKRGLDTADADVNVRYNCRWSDGTADGESKMFASFWSAMKKAEQDGSTLYYEIRNQRGAEAVSELALDSEDSIDASMVKYGVDSIDELEIAIGNEEMAGIVPFRAFVYSPAELRILRAKAREHAGQPGIPSLEEIDEWFTPSREGRPESAKVVDLLAFVKTYLHIPRSDRRLKTIAPYVGHYWTADDPNGLAATYKADTMYATTDPEAREEARSWLWKYNKDDCVANLAVRRWIDSVTFKDVAQLDAEGVYSMRFPRRALRRRQHENDLTLF